MRYGYARVSTVGQDLDDQLARLKAEGCDVIYSEKITGTRADRPEFQRLLDALQDGDTLTVTKLDRFARNAEDAIHTIKALLKRGVRVHILNMGVVEDTPMGRLMVTMLSGFAEFERDMIVERMAEGKAIARQREGYREGRPRKYTVAQIEHAMKLLDAHSYTEVERMTGISKPTLTRYRRKQKAQS
ncbi:recombinase family protein [Bhargavaea beijingensis]|uniref:recombinase family protein n=1 Tax=Bhargavaea beijingensis TaxID=426756 RepID=UPI002225285F|nr:recombinase family protein [Bhargavaea beijingensis]MCW1926945.1 recombinase family protein [Bhargavaea beijingensis]